MNWLAHLHLCPKTPADRVGNLIPDLIGGMQQRIANTRYQPGMITHRLVDKFTDAHPIVKLSCNRVPKPWRRFGGVLTDLFYDHFLSLHWEKFCSMDRLVFIASCYSDFQSETESLPPEAQDVFERMREQDWLGSYITVDGMRLTLRRVGARLRRELHLEQSITVLEENHTAFEQDFLAFYPELQKFVNENQSKLHAS